VQVVQFCKSCRSDKNIIVKQLTVFGPFLTFCQLNSSYICLSKEKQYKMKNLIRAFLITIFTGSCIISSAQNEKAHSIGIQLNPYLDEFLFTGTSFKSVFALRYTFNIKDHITVGPEVSGYNVKLTNLDPNYKFSNFNVGGFLRYSFFPSYRLKPFFEISPYYTFFSYKNLPENTYEGVPPNGKDSYVSGYLAPGISLLSKSQKISLDLICKFSNKAFVNGNQFALSYRLNFRF
jgi:hypothetical protein